MTYGYHGSGLNYLLHETAAGAGGGGPMTYTRVGYDYVGNATSTTDALGRQSFAFYDANRRSLGNISDDPDGSAGGLSRRATRFQYNADGQVNAIFEGTAAGNSLANLTGMNVLRYVAIDYDGNGRKVKSKLVDGANNAISSTEYSYDAAGRPQCTAVRMDPASFNTAPNACAQKSGDTLNNPDRVSETAYNAAGTLSYLRNGLTVPALYQNTLTYYYTGNGKVAAVIDANGNRTGYEYDGFDRLAKTYYPSPTTPGTSSTTDYEELIYDAGSRVTERRLRGYSSDSNARYFLGYDDAGRVVARYYYAGNNNANVTYQYDLLGRMTNAQRGNGAFGASVTATYDALGRKLTDTSYYQGVPKTISYGYDAMGQRTSINIDGLAISYSYDKLGEMTNVSENGSMTLANLYYDDLGRRGALGRLAANDTFYSFDVASRLVCLKQDLAGGGGLNCDPAASGSDQAVSFAYNSASQITSRTAANDTYAWTQAYNVNRSYASNGLNQYSSIASSATITPTYDPRGNLTAAGSNSYSYSADNELTGANGMRLDYDPAGRLVYSSSSHTRFLYDGSNLVAEYDDGGNLLRRYVHGPGVDEPLVWYEGSGTGDKRWLRADERGSIMAVTDASGNALSINSYDPWGIPQTTNLGRFQYTGQTWMPELGIYYYKARFYSATLGRFLQTDPIGYEDGPNWYAYVGNDPVNAKDPSGLACQGPCPYLQNTTPLLITSYQPSSPKGPETSFGSAPDLLAFYKSSQAANGAVRALVRNSPALMKNPALTSKIKPNASSAPDPACSGGVYTFGGQASATGFLATFGLSGNLEAGIALPIRASSTWNPFVGSQLYARASGLGLAGMGFFAGAGLSGVGGINSTSLNTGWQDSFVAQGGLAFPAGGEAAISLDGSGASISGGPRAGIGGYLAGGAGKSLTFATKPLGCPK